MIEKGQDIGLSKTDFIAAIRHIGWVAYQIAVGQEYNEKMNNDQCISLLDGISVILANPEITPEANHENWMRKKKDLGWVYGETKDFERKTHPVLLPFNELPDIEKRKDIADSVSHRLALDLWGVLVK